jgi:uncharacterized membrane protein
MKRLLILLLLLPTVFATTLTGQIYGSGLELEENVLLTVNTVPEQKMLIKEGNYQLILNPGSYKITLTKGTMVITEDITIDSEGTFHYDFFLVPNINEETDIWQELRLNYDDYEEREQNPWSFLIITVIFALLLFRYYYYRKKYSDLSRLRLEIKKDSTLLDKTIKIIKKNDGRITQKELRTELNHLSESKVSLIITELQSQGKVKKIKQGRGNVVILV